MGSGQSPESDRDLRHLRVAVTDQERIYLGLRAQRLGIEDVREVLGRLRYDQQEIIRHRNNLRASGIPDNQIDHEIELAIQEV